MLDTGDGFLVWIHYFRQSLRLMTACIAEDLVSLGVLLVFMVLICAGNLGCVGHEDKR
jgi:hypothetical protein